MKQRLPRYLFLLILLISTGCNPVVPPPEPYGTIPTDRQLKWQEMEIISLIHFGLNTFTDKEWGYGDVSPDKFNPVDFDPGQIVSAAESAGIKGIIFVAKHHDGFCLWPTKTTSYNISQSSWKNGKGDLVKAFQEAAGKNGLAFGIYCSPWDRHSPDYGWPEYINTYRSQLRELYNNYGLLFEAWFDGANGGDGYYGGADTVRTIDKATYYGWDSTWKIVRDLQPGAVIFSDAGRDVRWVGNEKGIAADSTWETFTPQGEDGSAPTPGNVVYRYSPTGTRNGKYWMPAECDVPLRPGWFYHKDQDGKEKSPEQLFDIYIHSVGRGGNMNLGLAPDLTGKLNEGDVQTLKRFGEILHKTFSVNLAGDAHFEASDVRGKNDTDYGTANLVDDNRYSYWATDDSVTHPVLDISLKHPAAFDIIQLRENIKLGQRIESVAISYQEDGEWVELGKVYGIGANRLIKLPQPVTTDTIRLKIAAPVCIALSRFGLFRTSDFE